MKPLSVLGDALQKCGTGTASNGSFLGDGFCTESDDDLCKRAICAKPNSAFLKQEAKLYKGKCTDGFGLRDDWQCMCGVTIREMVSQGGGSVQIDRSATPESQHWLHLKWLEKKYPQRVQYLKSSSEDNCASSAEKERQADYYEYLYPWNWVKILPWYWL
ncbi:unnamed protein product [Amoebophrya sp. A120]|nr:unnamed protein product [Amoebophrya sp. A120]|eukprot:GSA120T00001001001.1